MTVSRSKLNEVESMLRRMREAWSQYDIDGLHDIWIVKPGDKSKGIGQLLLLKFFYILFEFVEICLHFIAYLFRVLRMLCKFIKF